MNITKGSQARVRTGLARRVHWYESDTNVPGDTSYSAWVWDSFPQMKLTPALLVQPRIWPHGPHSNKMLDSTTKFSGVRIEEKT